VAKKSAMHCDSASIMSGSQSGCTLVKAVLPIVLCLKHARLKTNSLPFTIDTVMYIVRTQD
jgi:hypothetical protein